MYLVHRFVMKLCKAVREDTVTKLDVQGSVQRRSTLTFCCALLAIVLSSFVAGSAQTNAPGNPQTVHPPVNINTPHQLVVTGCLRRDSASTYSITNENGKTFDLIPAVDSVDLSKHVFHAVRITGKEAPNVILPGTADSSPQSPPPAVLRVLTLEVLSNSCTR